MPYSLIAHTGVQSNGDNGTTPAVDSTSADFIALGAAYKQGVAITISDNQANAFTPLTESSSLGNNAGRLYIVKRPIVGANHTFSVTSTGGLCSLCVAVFKGSLVDGPFDSGFESGNVVSGTTIQPGSITPRVNSLMVTLFASGAADSIDSGFIITDTEPTIGGVCYGSTLAYKIKQDAAAENPTWSAPSAILIARMASFKATLPVRTGLFLLFPANP